MTRRMVPVAAVAVLAIILAAAAPAYAQHRSGGYHGGYYSGSHSGWYTGYPGYHGGYSGYYGAWPASSLALGIGTGPVWSYPYYAWTNPSATYSYYYPRYTYVNPPVSYVAPSVATNPPVTAGYEESTVPPVAAAAYAAQMTIRVPPGADLWIDNYRSGQTGEIRKFESPSTLEPGRTYTYTLTASWNNGDQIVNRVKKVIVEPGRNVYVDMTQP